MARLIAHYPIKHDDGTAQPGDTFEGDESLIEQGLAEADPSTPPVEPVPPQQPTRAVRRAAADPSADPVAAGA